MPGRAINIVKGLIAAFLCLQTSCSPFPHPKAQPVIKTYLLEGTCATRHAGPSASKDMVLAVAPTRSAPGYDTERMAYTVKAYRLDHFAFHRWMRPPASMFHRNLLNAIGERGSFRAVVDGTSPARMDLRLETEDFYIRQVFENERSRAETGLRARIVELASRRVISEKSFIIVEPSESPDPDGGVHAANHAVSRLMDEIIAWMDSAAPPLEETGSP